MRTLLFISLWLILFNSTAQDKSDTTKIKKKFELSFGQSLLFISYNQSLNVLNQSAIVVPTSSILLFSVFRPLKRFHIPLFCNIPTESKQYLINGILTNERANPTLGTGIEAWLFKFPLAQKAKLEMNIAALGSTLLTKNHEFIFAPIAAARLRIMQNENFVMYLGSSYSFGINAWGLLYGTGYIF
jgi:hypothetical protein